MTRRLDREETRVLKDLIRADREGRPIGVYISETLYEGEAERDKYGRLTTRKRPEYTRLAPIYEQLADAGLLLRQTLPRVSGYTDLTSAGRCYFSERRRDRLERYGPAAASAAMGMLGVVLGVVLERFVWA